LLKFCIAAPSAEKGGFYMNPVSSATSAIEWVKGCTERADGLLSHTQRASYSLRELAGRGLLDREAVNSFLLDSGLRDYSWHLIWSDEAATSDADLPEKISSADGYAVFIHGWTGSHAIWEALPEMVVTSNPRIVALVVDHNGFGATQFLHPMPALALCGPNAAMRAAERWFDLLNLRRPLGALQAKTVNWIGHSMGGAALFFIDEAHWRLGEMTRTALAPALLIHDETHRTFYTALGLGIGLVGRIHALEVIDQVVSPNILDVLAEGATALVKAEHARIYDTTPKGVTARTFAAMGTITDHPQPHRWELMRVVLAHRDRLVGLTAMIDLLQELAFDVNQVRVVAGTHYLFSVGSMFQRAHEQNRQIVLKDILTLHTQALAYQRTGQRPD